MSFIFWWQLKVLLLVSDWLTPFRHFLGEFIGLLCAFHVVAIGRHQIQLRKNVVLECVIRLSFLWTGKTHFVFNVARLHIELISDDCFWRGVIDCNHSFYGPWNLHFIFALNMVTSAVLKYLITFGYLTMSWWFLQCRWSRSGNICCCSAATLVVGRRYLCCTLFRRIWPLF